MRNKFCIYYAVLKTEIKDVLIHHNSKIMPKICDRRYKMYVVMQHLYGHDSIVYITQELKQLQLLE